MARSVVGLFVLVVLCAALSVAPSGQSSAPSPTSSGVTITGSVVDSSLAPIAGATVTLDRGGQVIAKTVSAAEGTFRFVNVAAGTYQVRAERAGFAQLTRELRLVADVAAVRLPLVLTRPGERLQDAKMAETTTTVTSASAPPPASMPPPPPAPVMAGQMGQAGGGGGGRGGGAVARSSSDAQIIVVQPEYRRQEVPWSSYRYAHSGELYAHVDPNRFQSAFENPLSTFGADVDTASYTNVRRFLSNGQLPPTDAVRVEEFINYFKFGYAEPRNGRPIGLTTEVGDCPWAPTHKLVLIGARARAPQPREITGRNLVLLLDVSGSMGPAERLPLIKTALGMFVDTLRPDDRLAIVTYAGTSGVALPSTPLRYRDTIQRAIAGLNAGGSTNGGSGLITAYRVAREAFIPGGVNRVILATDGDFNVGLTSQMDLLRLIERERESGVFLSVLGVGSGNLKDATMEMLADKGNGNYSYLDSLQEARRVLMREADATIETVAKDVKFQVEFNPALVNAWKLIGYENRVLAAQDFNDDRKDSGDMGASHTVTVLYEIIPAGVESPDGRSEGRPIVDPLRYQTPEAPRQPQPRPATVDAATANEWLTVKARYKAPEGDVSDLITVAVPRGGRVQHLPTAAAIAEFGLLLQSGTRNDARWDALVERVARIDMPAVAGGDRGESFRELVAIARGLARLR